MVWSRSRSTGEVRTPRPYPRLEPDDGKLAAAAQTNPQAFAGLYDRYIGLIYRYCHVRLGSHEAAEDATSETFLKALAALDRYRHRSFSAWLFRIAQNVIIDGQRRRKVTAPLAAAAGLADPARLPDEVAIIHAERDAVRAALAALPDDQRAAIELQYAGWSGQQIADALDKTPAAVKMLRVRALNRLRALLVESEAPSGRADAKREEAHRVRD